MIYAMSDIHGFYDIFKSKLELLDLDDPENSLVLLGDYIDYGDKSLETLRLVLELQKKYPERVIALRGNHEDYFLEFLDGGEIGLYPETLNSFLDERQWENLKALAGDIPRLHGYIRRCVLKDHGELIRRMRNLPLYYETERQIFVHAGIDEEAGKHWRDGTPDYYFIGKFPPTTGAFYKDIIAGHTGTSEISGDSSFFGVYYDGRSHYYIDGSVEKSRDIPVLAWDGNAYYSVESGGGLTPVKKFGG